MPKDGSDSFEKNEYYLNFGPTLGLAYQFRAQDRGARLLRPDLQPCGRDVLLRRTGRVCAATGLECGEQLQLGRRQAGADIIPASFTKATTDYRSLHHDPVPGQMDPRALRLGYSEAFNVGVQQQLTPNTRLEISYVGNRGHRLTDAALAWNETSTSNFLSLVRKIRI